MQRGWAQQAPHAARICGRTLSGSSREQHLGLLRKLPATIRGEGDEERGISFFIARYTAAILMLWPHRALGPLGLETG